MNRIFFTGGAAVALLAFSAIGPAQEPLESANLDIDAARIIAADEEPGNWLAHGRTYSEQRFSPLDQITDENVNQLGLAWSYPTGVDRGHEASPIVVDGVMIFTLPWSEVVALNAATGEELWRYDPDVPEEWARNACCDVINRGVAVWKGLAYVGTIDGRLIALDAKTGIPKWGVQTTPKDRPYTITGAPRVVKDKVIIGNGGAELGVRGYITAYDAATGEQQWRFYTVPGNPEEPFEHPELEMAAETWDPSGAYWEVGGGGTAWDSMAYDPELDLLYVGTGNGSPWNREIRSPGGGDNLFLSSILALDPDTGRMKWHYQTTPADNWDYTATQHMILAELEIDGEERKIIMQAPKNGFFYVLDRETGELLSAEKYTPITWASHVDMETGKPVETGGGVYQDQPQLVIPSPTGGHNWHPMAYSPQTDLVYIPTISEPLLYVNDDDFQYRPWTWNTGIDFAAAVAMVLASGEPLPELAGYLKAWDPVEQKEVWSVKHPTIGNGGVLATAGNLVFQGTGTGYFVAYRATDGEKLWEVKTNIGIVAPPISYKVGNDQYVAILAGWGGHPPIVGADFQHAIGVKRVNDGQMLVFKLSGETPMPDVPEKRIVLIPEPPAVEAPADVIVHGQNLYHTSCFQCHGAMAVSAGVIADLRYSSTAVHQNWNKIVLEGALDQVGMASFSDLLSEDDSRAIQAYVVQRAQQDRQMQLQMMEQQAQTEAAEAAAGEGGAEDDGAKDAGDENDSPEK